MKKYRKIIKYKKKPDKWGIFLGILGWILSVLMLLALFKEENGVIVSTFVFTLMFIYSIRITNKSRGKGKKVYYNKFRGNFQ